MPLSEPQLVELTRRFQTIIARIAQRSGVAVTRVWDRLDSYDVADIERFARLAAPVFQASQQSSVAAAVGFYSTLAEIAPPAITAASVPVAPDVRGPFTVVWRALSNGHDYADAVLAGRSRAEASVSNLVHSTARQTGHSVSQVADMRVVGWRRVLTGKSCTWCATVSTQRYRSAESANFGHDRCDCTAVPIFGDRDPGRVINTPIYDRLRATPDSEATGYVDATGAPAPRS